LFVRGPAGIDLLAAARPRPSGTVADDETIVEPTYRLQQLHCDQPQGIVQVDDFYCAWDLAMARDWVLIQLRPPTPSRSPINRRDTEHGGCRTCAAGGTSRDRPPA